jgi:hypothetical protein
VPDGRVFIMGGLTNPNSDSAAQNAVEVFDPATRTFATAGRLTRPRFGFTATLLPNGRILVVGGGWGSAPAQTAELYDPATGTSEPVNHPLTPRYYGAAVALSDGRVALVGGEDKDGTAIRAIEIYDPKTNTFTLGGDAVEGRFRPAVASLRDGRILMAGGVPYSRSNEAFGSIEIYDPAVGQSAVAGRMETERSFAQAVSLKDGTILLAGGYRPNEAGEWTVLQTAELFDPVAGTVSTAGPMAGARTAHAAVGLLDGRVLLVGGWNHSTGQLATAEVYVPGK